MWLLVASIGDSDFVPDAVVSRAKSCVNGMCERWVTTAGLPIARFSAPWGDIDHPDAVVK